VLDVQNRAEAERDTFGSLPGVCHGPRPRQAWGAIKADTYISPPCIMTDFCEKFSTFR
jgi:hypothetical protein